jgi:hypothetical protein
MDSLTANMPSCSLSVFCALRTDGGGAITICLDDKPTA